MAGKPPRGAAAAQLDKFAFTKDQDELQKDATALTDATAQQGVPTITLLDVMATLQQVQASIGTISTDISLIRADFAKLSGRLLEVETTTQELKADTTQLQRQVRQLEADNKQILAKLEDQEGRSRRNNVRIIGVPESAGGPALDLFVEDLIKNQLQPRGLSKFFSVERAHRVPGGKPKPGVRPRPILARIFNFRDRDVILQAARVAPPIQIDNQVITLYPDYTAMVTKQRQGFLDVKKELRDRDLKYSMLFPAKLRVEAEGKVWFFHTPEETKEWLEGWRPAKKTPRNRNPRNPSIKDKE